MDERKENETVIPSETGPASVPAFFDCDRFLERKGWTRKGLAKQLGFQDSTVGNWCTGASTPNFATVARLIGFGITARELFGEELGEMLLENSARGPEDVAPEIFSSPKFRAGMEMLIAEMKKEGKI